VCVCVCVRAVCCVHVYVLIYTYGICMCSLRHSQRSQEFPRDKKYISILKLDEELSEWARGERGACGWLTQPLLLADISHTPAKMLAELDVRPAATPKPAPQAGEGDGEPPAEMEDDFFIDRAGSLVDSEHATAAISESGETSEEAPSEPPAARRGAGKASFKAKKR
jgi:hypothetical protein